MTKSSTIQFRDERLKKAFNDLKKSTLEDERKLHKWLIRAFDDIKENAFCGIQIHKKLIPKEYIKRYSVDNLWKYDLPKAWRLLYSIVGNEIEVISILVEWLDHKNYEKRFKY